MRDKASGRLLGVVSLLAPILTTIACGGSGGSQDPEVPAESAGEAVRILPLGDSITEGIDARSSYRYWLDRGLREAGVELDFVGSLRGPVGGADGNAFDADHEGHWGWRADEVAARLDSWLAAAEADVVLLHLGHNDLGAGEAPSEVAAEVAELVARIRDSPSRPHVLVAEVIPVSVPALAAGIGELNEALAARVEAIADPGVRLVDLATGFDAGRRTADGIHPNEEGARWMAERWLAALLDVLDPM
ncbi:MAG: SGNH/GDSL hydrolase family protein [Thermoanaerobaculia bacterium]